MKDLNKNNRCPLYENCGGCQLQTLSYDEQLKFKQEKIDKLLSNFHFVNPIIGCKEKYNYRNKVQVSFGKDRNGKIIVGNYVPSTHIIVPVKECQIADTKANKIIDTIKKLVIKYNISIFDENSFKGCIRHVQVRCTNLDQYMVILVTGTSKIYKGDLLVKELLSTHTEIKTVIQNINNKRTSMVLGDKNYTLYGTGYIKDKLCGLDFSLSPTAFYQVNKYQTEVLYEKAMELAKLKGDEVAIDAYCGIGTISLLLSKRVKQVLGVEINKNAIKDAKYNAKLNKINNVEFLADDAGRFMSRIAKENKNKIDVVCMDPPRAGADEKFLKSLITLNPKKIIYISCGPESLKSNLGYLTKHGYKIDEIQPVDMFPYTEHIETIVILTKGTFLPSFKKRNDRKVNNVTKKVTCFCLCLPLFGLNFNSLKMFFGPKIKEPEVMYSLIDSRHLNNLFKNNNGNYFDIASPEYYVTLDVWDGGYDIYYPTRSGYRYGPSIIKYDDGSVDAFFASPGNGSSEWDYIRYRHMSPGGIWSKEEIVLKPTPDSKDHFSVCDPAVFFYDGYYYLAYTSTDSSNQMNNSIFVARSLKPNGPYEKWSGDGWGGDPEPIIYYDLQDDAWGAGEPSFVIKDDVLYVYYSWLPYSEYTTRVMCAPLSENWPQELEYKGISLLREHGEDSFDVVYVETIDKFLAFANINKMTGLSSIGVYQSDDGVVFDLVDKIEDNVKIFTHNLGISKGVDGHVKLGDNLILGYAYSPNQTTMSWGRWATRFHNVTLNVVFKIEED